MDDQDLGAGVTGADDQCDNICWICLGEGEAADPLHRVCKCPRRVHKRCLARWQLQSAGRLEERCCRFCNSTLPSWKTAFAAGDLPPAVPVMSIHFAGSTYWLQVHPGSDGLEKFKSDVRRLLHLGDEQAFDISFECKVPGTPGCKMELRGLDAFDAAVYCASLTAAERVKTKGHAGARAKEEGSSSSPGRHRRSSSDASSLARSGSLPDQLVAEEPSEASTVPQDAAGVDPTAQTGAAPAEAAAVQAPAAAAPVPSGTEIEGGERQEQRSQHAPSAGNSNRSERWHGARGHSSSPTSVLSRVMKPFKHIARSLAAPNMGGAW